MLYKTQILPNGQWKLEKFDDNPPKKEDYSHIHDTHTSIPTGTHEIEIHPHMDQLYNIKGAIKESGKEHLHFQDLKKLGYDKSFLNRHVPSDGKGKVTSEMIDDHIEKLPKRKATVTVVPFKNGYQQHRDGEQHVISVKMHDDELDKLHPKTKDSLKNIMLNQHHFDGTEDKPGEIANQIGWARIDPKGHHWHVDEIQSDFGTPSKFKNGIKGATWEGLKDKYWQDAHTVAHDDAIADASGHFGEDADDTSEEWNDFIDNQVSATQGDYVAHMIDDHTNMHGPLLDDDHIGHTTKELKDQFNLGHDDPQHMIHSVVNQLARKHNIKSMSMDTPEDQAIQSGLKTVSNDFENAVKKIGGVDSLKNVFHDPHYQSSEMRMNTMNEFLDEHKDKLTDKEGRALKSRLQHQLHNMLGSDGLTKLLEDSQIDQNNERYQHLYDTEVKQEVKRQLQFISEDLKGEKKDTPVHQKNTYDKRPKKLGMKPHRKDDVLGEDPEDSQEHVQYHKLHKSLIKLKKALKDVGR